MINKFKKRLNDARNDIGGFTLLDGVVASSIVLALATGTGVISYNTIQNNQKEKTTNIASESGYNKALSNLTDFDKDNDSIESLVESLNSNEEGFVYTVKGNSKETLCVTAFYEASPSGEFYNENDGNNYKFSNTSGSCSTPKEPNIIEPPAIADTVTRLSLQCDWDVNERLPFERIKDNNLKVTIKSDNGESFTIKNEPSYGINTWITEKVNFKAGVNYQVIADGTFEKYNTPLSLSGCIKSVDKLGEDSGVTSLNRLGGNKLESVPTSIPATVTNLDDAFLSAKNFNKNLNTWDVSNVTSFYRTFSGAQSFNNGASIEDSRINDKSSPLKWNTRSAKNMSLMFHDTRKFNQDLTSFKIDLVTNMSEMFRDAFKFNGDVTNWNTNNVVNMSGIFEEAKVFNKNISSWSVKNVENLERAFYNTKEFNQPIGNWKFEKLNNLKETFAGSGFNSNINDWNVSLVTTLEGTFRNNTFNQPLNKWDTSKVTSMRATFLQFYGFQETDVAGFNQDISTWKTTNVTDMTSMFSGNTKFNKSLDTNEENGTWDVSNVKSMNAMFFNTREYNQPMPNWKTNSLTSTSQMFDNSYKFNQPLNHLNVSKVTDMHQMFYNAQAFNQPLNEWTLNIKDGDMEKIKMSGMFNMTKEFNQPLNNWNVKNVNNMASMFNNAKKFNQPLNNWFKTPETSNVTNMSSMFYGNDVFKQNISMWNVDKVSNWSGFKTNSSWSSTMIPAKFR